MATRNNNKENKSRPPKRRHSPSPLLERKCTVILEDIKYNKEHIVKVDKDLKKGDVTCFTYITDFHIHDRNGQSWPVDTLDNSIITLYISGKILDNSSDGEGKTKKLIFAKKSGPILNWSIRNVDTEDKLYAIVKTKTAKYVLLSPRTAYAPLMSSIYEKLCIHQVIEDYSKAKSPKKRKYDEVLQNVLNHTIPELNNKKMSDKILRKHFKYFRTQTKKLKIRENVLPKVETKKEKHPRVGDLKTEVKALTIATTTPLVRNTFEGLFAHLLELPNQKLDVNKHQCGVCNACQLPDCGECSFCRSMPKFGGNGDASTTCIHKKCVTMSWKPDNENIVEQSEEPNIQVNLTETYARRLIWPEKPLKVDAVNTYYENVKIDNLMIKIGDFVMVDTAQANIPALVARVVYIWKDCRRKSGYFHGEMFIRATDTILGEAGHPREVFMADYCCHSVPLSSILRKATVTRKSVQNNWSLLGGTKILNNDNHKVDDGRTYNYEKFYNRFLSRFEDIPTDPVCPNRLRKHYFCPSCERKTKTDFKLIPMPKEKLDKTSDFVLESNRAEWKSVVWKDFHYKKGCGVFLKPHTFRFSNQYRDNNIASKLKKVDENLYTEYYRKITNSKRCNSEVYEPFCVGCIVAITTKSDGLFINPLDIYLKVYALYRPENTSHKHPQKEDLNMLYWSSEVIDVPFTSVCGPCSLYFIKNIPDHQSLSDWSNEDFSRFYFKEAYDKTSEKFIAVPVYATTVGQLSSDDNNLNVTSNNVDIKVRPLKTLDVFAGCGGLSEGLHQAEVAQCKWAIDNEATAAESFALNNKECAVFNADCNAVLQEVMSGRTHSEDGLPYPKKGEVELLCGGPPCQGFSGLNRFSKREYSIFKNSLIVTFLSYCDYYRPKYIIMENVRNFVVYKKGMMLKLTFRALLDMGYQCTFGILQAGNYGVPQTRRRLIIFASAPGCKLPLYPEPSHVFNMQSCSLNVTVDNKIFLNNIECDYSAPRRSCTIWDAMSDLPIINNGADKCEISYHGKPKSHFQRLIRGSKNNKLRDHICKNMSLLVQERIANIPTTAGSDWRDLPNIAVTLSDGTKCQELKYLYDDKKNGRSRKGALRGVCPCAAGLPCLPSTRQRHTLLPWALPHTATANGNWAGVYGRLSWDGYFSTTVTDPEPQGTQGRVLHPQQHRVVSVRECARSQGFHDEYVLAGSIQDKHRQVGNAVPPPLAAALGRELKKAIQLTEQGA